MREFFIDTETFNRQNLKLVGKDRYMNDPSLECLLVTFARDDKPVQCWDVTDGSGMPAELEDHMFDERITKIAHNAPFDKPVLANSLFLETEWPHWHCTMSQAYAHGLPASLEAVGAVVGLPPDMRKLSQGKELIDLFCMPQRSGERFTRETNPAEWQKFIDYGVQDTATLREIYRRLPKHNYRREHHALWVADMEINDRGFLIDQDLCGAAIKMRSLMEDAVSREIEALTEGRVTKGTQRDRILHEIVGEHGELMLDMTRDTMDRLLERPNLDPQVRRLLELRITASLTSLAKYARALERVGPDGRMRDTLQYSGAGRTGRWAGRGVQPHNMPRPKRDSDEIVNKIVPAIIDGSLPQQYVDVNGACQDALRSMIVAAPGCEFVVSDWSNIEGRVCAWSAGEDWKLEAFRANDAGRGEDLYKILFSELMGVLPEDVSKSDRQQGKVFELAFQYGGGVGACVTAAATYGVDLAVVAQTASSNAPPEMYTKAEKTWERNFLRGRDFTLEPDVYIGCDVAKQLYRRKNPAIMQLWWDVERACKDALRNPGSVHHVGRCKIWRSKAYLIVELPSKRRLLYAQPKLHVTVEFDEMDENDATLEERIDNAERRAAISYMHAFSSQWKRTRTYGGKLVENITQAIANDVLRAALLNCRADDWPVILHVHDEIVAEVVKGTRTLAELNALMERDLWWSQGLPLKAAGYVSQRYKKD